MSRALIAFLFRCWQTVWTPALGLVPLFILNRLWGQPGTHLLMGMVLGLSIGALQNWRAYRKWRPNFWLWRLSRRVVSFRTLTSDRVSLLFPAGLDEAINLQEVIRWSVSDLDDLSQRFGTRLRRRLTVVLFSSHRDITADFGRPMGGTALVQATAVVLGVDCPLREALRHELAHLFAFRWNMWAPPLIQEGLAVWLQKTTPHQTDPAEDTGSALPFDTDPSLLLDPHYFFASDRMHVCYALAGGFTGFLIRRFGWDHYRRFYSQANHLNFREVFHENFALSYEEAWRCGHDESVERASQNRMLEVDRLFNPPP
jgi:hypothetical protein